MDNTEKVLSVLVKPLTNIEISYYTKINHREVGKILGQLRDSGLIISSGATAARRHMRLSTAIEMLFTRTSRLERALKKAGII